MNPLPLEEISNAGVSFMRLADPPAVIMILVFSFVLLRVVWVPRRWRPSSLTVVALLLSVPITFLCSVSEEVTWGRRFFWRAVLQNGSVAIVIAFLSMPYLYKRWPGLLDDAPLFLSTNKEKEE